MPESHAECLILHVGTNRSNHQAFSTDTVGLQVLLLSLGQQSYYCLHFQLALSENVIGVYEISCQKHWICFPAAKISE